MPMLAVKDERDEERRRQEDLPMVTRLEDVGDG
jgi:hypothetical protein